MKKAKVALIICLVIGICSILAGSFAYYRIVVSGNINLNTGNAVFVLKDSDNNVWENKVISLNGGNAINPGDSGSFTVTMDASGSDVDMYATLEIDRGTLPTNLKFYITSDKKSELHKYYSFLETNSPSETLTIYWYWNPYIDNLEDNKFINQSNLEATIKVSAVQISDYATMKNGYNVDENKNDTSTEFWNATYRKYIRTIKFDNDLSNLPSSCTEENLCWDISENENQSKKVYGYLVDSGLKDSKDNTKPLYNLYIVSEATIFAPSDCSYIFSFDFTNIYENTYNLISIDFNNNFNTSKVTDMSYMFYANFSLTSLDLSTFNTSNVTDMSSMFRGCSSLTNLNISNFNTSNVTNISFMFYSCKSLTTLDLSNFNTSKVTDMGYMFNLCTALTKLDVGSFNTSNVTNMNEMFGYCSSLTNLELSNFNTSKVTNMDSMFERCTLLQSLDLSSFNTSNVMYMGSMFYECSSLISLDLSNFNTSKVTDMSMMFDGCTLLQSLDLSSFNTSKVINMTQIFSRCSSLKTLDLNNFDTIKVESMDNMFADCSKLTTTINIMNSIASNYSNMFRNAASESGAKITVNYIADASTLVDNMIATKSSNSNIVKGTVIPEYTITISGNDDIKYESSNRIKGTTVTLLSISGNNWVTSFKMNGTLVEGNTFTMPGTNVTISDIVVIDLDEFTSFETAHNPYANSQNNVVIGEKTFDGATSLTVILDYEMAGVTEYFEEYFYIYDSASATEGINNNKKYGGYPRTREVITINSNYIKITFTSSEYASGLNFYGLKATIIPNY